MMSPCWQWQHMALCIVKYLAVMERLCLWASIFLQWSLVLRWGKLYCCAAYCSHYSQLYTQIMMSCFVRRVVGIGLTTLFPDLGIQSVTFTMLGAASLTSGVSHLSLWVLTSNFISTILTTHHRSLTVILIEATDCMYPLFFLSLCLIKISLDIHDMLIYLTSSYISTDAYYALPVMVAVMVARSVSSYFVCSINVIFNRYIQLLHFGNTEQLQTVHITG